MGHTSLATHGYSFARDPTSRLADRACSGVVWGKPKHELLASHMRIEGIEGQRAAPRSGRVVIVPVAVQ